MVIDSCGSLVIYSCGSLVLYLDNDRMAASNIDAQGGFVFAANMVQGAAAVAQAAVGAPDVVDLVDDEAASAGAHQGPMRWTSNMSGFVLRRMAHIVTEGGRTDKTYKDKDVNAVAKALKEYSGSPVSPTQVYNHLRKWKQKWSKVAKLKDLSGATFDDDVHAIMLEQDYYLGHCKVSHSRKHCLKHSLLNFVLSS